ncbi:hypothetical protein HDU82_007139 [Entophlyctis luteolus]|nr:hypothetical protein HDU82_007139 [Entophlyctis luteolus]
MADKDVQDLIGFTALHYAIYLDEISSFRLLFDRGAKIDILDKVIKFIPLLVTELVQSGMPLFFHAIKCKRGIMAEQLLKNVPAEQLNIPYGPDQSTALHYAVENSLKTIVHLLIQMGANPTALDSEKRKPIERINYNEYDQETVDFLTLTELSMFGSITSFVDAGNLIDSESKSLMNLLSKSAANLSNHVLVSPNLLKNTQSSFVPVDVNNDASKPTQSTYSDSVPPVQNGDKNTASQKLLQTVPETETSSLSWALDLSSDSDDIEDLNALKQKAINSASKFQKNPDIQSDDEIDLIQLKSAVDTRSAEYQSMFKVGSALEQSPIFRNLGMNLISAEPNVECVDSNQLNYNFSEKKEHSVHSISLKVAPVVEYLPKQDSTKNGLKSHNHSSFDCPVENFSENIAFELCASLETCQRKLKLKSLESNKLIWQICKLQNDSDSHTNAMEVLKNEIVLINTAANEKELILQDQISQNKQLTDEIATKAQEISSIKNLLSSHNSATDSLMIQICTLSEENSQTMKHLENERQNCLLFDQKLQNAEMKISEVLASHLEIKGELDTAQSKNQILENQLAEVKQINMGLEDSLQSLQNLNAEKDQKILQNLSIICQEKEKHLLTQHHKNQLEITNKLLNDELESSRALILHKNAPLELHADSTEILPETEPKRVSQTTNILSQYYEKEIQALTSANFHMQQQTLAKQEKLKENVEKLVLHLMSIKKSASEKHQSMENQIMQLTKSKIRLEERLKHLENQLVDKEKKIAEYVEEVSLEKENHMITKSIQCNLEKSITALNEKLVSCNAVIDQQAENELKLNTELCQAQKNIYELEQQISENDAVQLTSVESTKIKISALEESLAYVNKQVKLNEEKLNCVTFHGENLKTEVKKRTSDIDFLENKISQLTDDTAVLEAKLLQSKEDFQANYLETKKQLDACVTEKLDLTHSISDLQVELGKLNTDFTEAIHNLQKTKEAHKNLDLRCQQLEHESTQLAQKNDTLRNENLSLKSTLEQCNVNVNELQNELAFTLKEHSDLKSQVVEMQKDKTSEVPWVQKTTVLEMQNDLISSKVQLQTLEIADLKSELKSLKCKLVAKHFKICKILDTAAHYKQELDRIIQLNNLLKCNTDTFVSNSNKKNEQDMHKNNNEQILMRFFNLEEGVQENHQFPSSETQKVIESTETLADDNFQKYYENSKPGVPSIVEVDNHPDTSETMKSLDKAQQELHQISKKIENLSIETKACQVNETVLLKKINTLLESCGYTLQVVVQTLFQTQKAIDNNSLQYNMNLSQQLQPMLALMQDATSKIVNFIETTKCGQNIISEMEKNMNDLNLAQFSFSCEKRLSHLLVKNLQDKILLKEVQIKQILQSSKEKLEKMNFKLQKETEKSIAISDKLEKTLIENKKYHIIVNKLRKNHCAQIKVNPISSNDNNEENLQHHDIRKVLFKVDQLTKLLLKVDKTWNKQNEMQKRKCVQILQTFLTLSLENSIALEELCFAEK